MGERGKERGDGEGKREGTEQGKRKEEEERKKRGRQGRGGDRREEESKGENLGKLLLRRRLKTNYLSHRY